MIFPADITTLFAQMKSLRVGVIGDFALDLYVTIQTETSETSLETGKGVFWGSQPRSSLGGAGNVVQNLVALGVTDIRAIGCVGNDLFGREMQYHFDQLGVNTEHLHIPATGWDTCVYTKPMLGTQEANRVDFGTHNDLPEITVTALLNDLKQALPQLDLLLINQQFPNPLLTEKRADQLNDLLRRFPAVRCVADMRDVGRLLPNATLKVNTAELARLLQLDSPPQPDLDWCVKHGRRLGQQRGGPVLITRGEAGILYVADDQTEAVAGLPLWGELDTVGAGDTVVAAFSACIGAGATPAQAIAVANLAAAVTVQKRHQTGTASLPEILNLYATYFPYESQSTPSVPSGTAYLPDAGAAPLLD